MSQDLHHSLLNHWQLLITVRKNFQCWNVFSPWENKRGSSDNELACCRGSVHLILSLWLLLKTTKTTHYTGCYIQTKLESFYFYKMYKNDVFTRNIEMVWTMLCEKMLFFWKKKKQSWDMKQSVRCSWRPSSLFRKQNHFTCDLVRSGREPFVL